jgi:hypothetical protein
MRRRLYRRATVTVALMCGLTLTTGPGWVSGAHADTVSDAAVFVNDINAARLSQGVGPLVVDSRLVGLAGWWAGQMAAAGGISHNAALAQMGPSGWSILGENVGMGPTVDSLVAAFRASPHHFDNMVNPQFSSIGVAEVNINGRLYVVEDFMGVGAQAPPAIAVVRGVAADPVAPGYWMAGTDGTVRAAGSAPFLGSPSGRTLSQPIVGITAPRDGQGYWLVAADGGVFTFGTAAFFGSTGGMHLNAPIVGMAPTATGHGYWLVASDGGIFSFGDARFLGSTGGRHLNAPIVGMAATPSGGGYWLAAADGGIFAFGDARFLGSKGGTALNRPIIAMNTTPTGSGYWLVASDGGIFTFGDAPFLGSTGGTTLGHRIAGMATTASGGGYWLLESDGTAHAFGNTTTSG